MEGYLRLLEKGNMGVETALIDLGLEGNQEVNFIPHKSQPTMETLTAEYLRAKKVALGAQILGVGLLENLSLELMTFLELLASLLYKRKIPVETDANQVGRALQIRIQHIKNWYESIGEVSEEGQQQHHSEWLCKFIGQAVEGDPEALRFFSLDEPLNIQIRAMKEVPNLTKLKMHFRRAKECAAVGDYLGDKQLLAIGKSVMTYAQYLAEMKHLTKLDVPIDGQDVAGGLLAHIQSLKQLREKIVRRWKGQQSGDEDSISNSDSNDGGENSSEEKVADPDYKPEKIRPKTKDQRCCKIKILPAPKKTTEQRERPATIENSVSVEENVCQTEEEKRISSQQEEERHNRTKPSETNKEEKFKKKRDHHSVKKCPLQTCGYEGPNLLRHLRAKHKMVEEEVVKLNSIAGLQGRRRGPMRKSKKGLRLGLKVKWCPFEGCNFATHILKKHLQRVHKLKNGQVLENYLRNAREYKGKLEQEEVLHYRNVKRKRSVLIEDPVSEPAAKTSKGDEEILDDYLEGYTTEQEDSGDDKDEACRERESLLEYFTAKNPRNDRHNWLIGFYNYLHYPDCGRKKNRNRLQHASHIKTILEDLDSGGSGIDILAEEEGYIVWTQWVDRNMGPKTSGTINAYLETLEMFLAFVTLDRIRPGTVPTLAEDVTKILRNTKERLKGWRRTVDLEMRPRRNQRLLDECDTRLTIDDVEKFKGSRPVVSARKTFQKASDGLPLTKDEICEARDLLICLITIKTGTRPGALENTQLQHYKTMRRDPVNGDPVMLIPEHKRSVDGPAMLALDEELVDLLAIYVEHIHPQFPSPRDDYLFLQTSGRRFTNGTINRRLPEMWLRSGVRTDLRVTATNIRKFIVTVLQENKIEGAAFDESGVRIAMCHTQKTAMYSYLREDLTAVASRAARTIKQFTDRSSNYQPLNSPGNKVNVAADKQPSNSAEKLPSTSHEQPLSNAVNRADADADIQPSSADEKGPSTSSEQPLNKFVDKGDVAVDKQGSHSIEKSPSISTEINSSKGSDTLPSTSSQRRPLADDEKKHIQEVFRGTIRSNATITMQFVRETMRKDDKLIRIEESEGMLKRVLDYLRNVQKNEPRQDPKQLPVVQRSEQVENWLTSHAESSSITSNKQKWSDEDTDKIVKVFTQAFGSLKKMPPRGEVRQIFQNELAEILERKEFLRCYNKVRHLVDLNNKKRKK